MLKLFNISAKVSVAKFRVVTDCKYFRQDSIVFFYLLTVTVHDKRSAKVTYIHN